MADITMPKMGFDMEEGTLVRWLKQVGDEVKRGEPIAEIETDKVTIEIEAFEAGTISEIVANEGDVVPVGSVIAKLGGDGAGAAPSAAAGQAEQAETAVAAEEQAAEDVQETVPAEQQTGEGGDAASQAAQQTEAGAEGRAAAAPREGYTDVTAEQETRGQPRQAAEAPQGRRMEPAGREGERVIASPVAKRLARENELDLQEISGSGPGGRIVRSDVEAYLREMEKAREAAPQRQPQAEAAPAPAPAPQPAREPGPGARREPMSRMRQTIARRMAQSKGPVPHFYVTATIDMDAAMALRQQLNASGDVKITVNDMVVKAAAIAIKKFPILNAFFADDALEYHDYVHVSIAVATENGLLAPAVTDVDKKSLGTVSAEIKELAERTRNGKVTPDELQRGTFSISNMGMYAVDSFSAIINPPQATIIAVGTVSEQPVVRDGQIVIGKVMQATISVDHRVADGAIAAQYMQEFKRTLENPMQILL